MSDDNPDVPRPPRFPYVAALLCAACIGAAAWTWMRAGERLEDDGAVLRDLRASVVRFVAAGLVVGAMGVFVFTMALRHWLAERKGAAE